jgi:mannose-1-phosphate guanylyltransferase
MSILPVILSGGSGTRLWPASRSMYPKQLLALAEERTMLQATALRTRGLAGSVDHCLVVCNEAHRFSVAEQLAVIEMDGRIILEPTGRITKNDEEFDLNVNESTYISIGDVHRIANPYDEPVHIIEVQ